MEPGIIAVVVVALLAGAGGWLWYSQRRQARAASPARRAEVGVETVAEKHAEARRVQPSPVESEHEALPLAAEITATLAVEEGPDAVVGGSPVGRFITIRQKRVTIGRNPRQVDIQLYGLDEQSSVSRLHCSIEFYPSMNCFMLTDEGSSSGTRIDGLPLTAHQPIALRDGDLIELGLSEKRGARLRFHTTFNPPEAQELRGGRLRVQAALDPKDTIRQPLGSEDSGAVVAPSDVFVSYSRKDRDVMRYIRESLTVTGLIVWSDESLEPGSKSWRGVVENAIENTRCVVALLSPDSKASKWVGEELQYAELHRKRIFPVLVRGDESASLPLGLTNVQFVDMRADYEGALENLLRVLRQYLHRDDV